MPERQLSHQDKRVHVAIAARELSRLLKEYWYLTPADRDELINTCADELVDVYRLLHSFMEPAPDREKMIKLNKEFTPLIEGAVNDVMKKSSRRKKK